METLLQNTAVFVVSDRAVRYNFNSFSLHHPVTQWGHTYLLGHLMFSWGASHPQTTVPHPHCYTSCFTNETSLFRAHARLANACSNKEKHFSEPTYCKRWKSGRAWKQGSSKTHLSAQLHLYGRSTSHVVVLCGLFGGIFAD